MAIFRFMPEVLSLPNREILKLYAGLKALDGVQSGGKIERFKFKASLVWQIAKNRRIVERAVETYEGATTALGAQFGVVDGQAVTPENAAEVAKFAAEREKILGETQELSGLLKMPVASLQENDNQIPPSTLSNLFVLLTE